MTQTEARQALERELGFLLSHFAASDNWSDELNVENARVFDEAIGYSALVAENAKLRELITKRSGAASWEEWSSGLDLTEKSPAEIITGLVAERDQLAAKVKTLRDAIALWFEPAHREGCLWLSNQQSPCQCGAADRVNACREQARAALASTKPEEPA